MNTYLKPSLLITSLLVLPHMVWAESTTHHAHSQMAQQQTKPSAVSKPVDHSKHKATAKKPVEQTKKQPTVSKKPTDHSQHKPASTQKVARNTQKTGLSKQAVPSQSKPAVSQPIAHHHQHMPTASQSIAQHEHDTQLNEKSSHNEHQAIAPPQQEHTQHNASAEVTDEHSQHAAAPVSPVDHSQHAITSNAAKQSISGMLRNPDYSDGIQSHAASHMHDNPNFWSIDAEKLQLAQQHHQNDDQYSGQYDVRIWYGNSANRLYINNEGELQKQKLTDASSEIAWWHAIAPYWNTSLGFKQDYGHEQRDQSWTSIGINGVAPYWFDVGANLYVSKDGDTQLKLSGSYDLYISQKLVLQPEIETTFYGKNNAAYQYGSGLSSIGSGFKLRYDITPQISPYIGFEHERFFGKTADYLRQDHEATHDSQIAVGLRFWY